MDESRDNDTRGARLAPLGLLLAAALLAATGSAQADSGFYIGGSVGSAMLESKDSEADFDFDGDDFAAKVFLGYNIDAFVIDLAVEGGYVDFGNPSDTVLASEVEFDVTGWDLFALAGVELGPVGVFAKAGMISWDADASIAGTRLGSDSGPDPAYGVGARFSLWSAEIRAEYEYFDVDSTDDLSMVSVGAAWTF